MDRGRREDLSGEAAGTRLSTHVLDTARGAPAAGIAVALYACGSGERTALGERVTNVDGRTDEPLATDLPAGVYEIVFRTSAYFSRDARAAFYDDIAIRFTIEPGRTHLHVPLLLAPYGYTTYRGS